MLIPLVAAEVTRLKLSKNQDARLEISQSLLTSAATCDLLKGDLGRVLLFRLVNDKQFRRAEVEHAGNEVARKDFAVGVIDHDRIVRSEERRVGRECRY